ncbi:MAG TPA: molybdopterin-dependent oxidoreductase [Vicinamibacteria bacterium]|jgi:anaerobic selenocysteine-containing dehydrogenase
MNENVREIRTSCVLDCPDACSLEVTVEGGRVAKIEAGTGNEVTRDFICSKVGRFADRLYHPDRLLYPMRRVGPKGAARFERIDWATAVRTITDRFREIRDTEGGEAILPYNYGGSNGFLTDDLVDSAYFARLSASRLAKTICAAPTSEVAKGMYGKMAGVAFPDYPEAQLILIWGANPRASNIHLVPFLQDAKARGAFIALVDPIRTLSTDLIDLHLPVYPGADLPLALGMIHHWKEKGLLDRAFLAERAVGLETLLEAAEEWSLDRASRASRVDRESIRLLAERYAEASPAVLRCGWGLERNRNGGQAAAAILAMPALLGKFGRRGGGYTLSNSGAGKLDAARLWDTSSWTTRVVNMTELARALNEPLSPPIKGLFVYNCNPVATVPDQNGVLRGLAREDLFTVVFEQVMTDTARYADVLLPATTFLEHYDFKRSYGSYVVGATKPVIQAVGEARSNASVFAELGRAAGFDDEIFQWTEAELRERVVAALSLQGKKVSPGPFTSGGIHGYDFDGSPNPVQFESVFPQTEDGKVHLAPPCLGPEPYAYEEIRSESFPLCLITPASAKLVSSTFGEFNLRELHLTIHPEDARRRGIAPGKRVRVWNDLGEVECVARVDAHVREGVVSLPKGAWMKSSLNGRTSTALTPSNVNVVGGGACFNDARVEVAPLR